MNKFGYMAVCAAVVAVALLAVVKEAEAVTCSVTELSPCASAMASSSPPSSACCQKLRDQTPCLCQYYKNPSLKKYVDSPAAKKVSSACRVSVKC